MLVDRITKMPFSVFKFVFALPFIGLLNAIFNP